MNILNILWLFQGAECWMAENWGNVHQNAFIWEKQLKKVNTEICK